MLKFLNDFNGEDIFLFSFPLNPLSGLAGAVKVQVECFGMRLEKGEKKTKFYANFTQQKTQATATQTNINFGKEGEEEAHKDVG